MWMMHRGTPTSRAFWFKKKSTHSRRKHIHTVVGTNFLFIFFSRGVCYRTRDFCVVSTVINNHWKNDSRTSITHEKNLHSEWFYLCWRTTMHCRQEAAHALSAIKYFARGKSFLPTGSFKYTVKYTNSNYIYKRHSNVQISQELLKILNKIGIISNFYEKYALIFKIFTNWCLQFFNNQYCNEFFWPNKFNFPEKIIKNP